VDAAADGEEGRWYARAGGYDAILLDLMLPGVDGMELLGRLRENRNHCPVLILTARGQVPDRVEGLNAGADDYLVKPFDFQELLARIYALIPPGSRPACISVWAFR
jgi:DNA-binding response OmpR family regulator